jgi:hypothetical protein
MLTIVIPESEGFDEATNEFVVINKQVMLTLEHSLVSISKWEAKWKKPFLKANSNRTIDETIDYIKCMTLTQNINPEVYQYLTPENYKEIHDYINDSMSASSVNTLSTDNKTNKEIITSELIYYWMITLNIPLECQKWHINRLLMLIQICNTKNAPKKKTNPRAITERNALLNKQRRDKLKSKG